MSPGLCACRVSSGAANPDGVVCAQSHRTNCPNPGTIDAHRASLPIMHPSPCPSPCIVHKHVEQIANLLFCWDLRVLWRGAAAVAWVLLCCGAYMSQVLSWCSCSDASRLTFTSLLAS